MNVALVSFTKIPAHNNSTVATVRLTKYIRERLESMGHSVDLVDSRESCRLKRYDSVVTVNGVFMFCDFKEKYGQLIMMNKSLVWVGQDYQKSMWIPRITTFDIPSKFRASDSTLVAAYEQKTEAHKSFRHYHYLNWNQLTFTPDLPERKPEVPGLFYYGACRESRLPYFKKYFTRPPYPLTISVPSPRQKTKFATAFPTSKFISCSDVVAEAGRYEAALYIEDEGSHCKNRGGIYSSPANRFYECLSAGVLTLFDSSVVPTFERARVDISPWVVSSPRELLDKMRDDGLRRRQRELYLAQNYKAKLDDEFGSVFGKILA